MVRGVSPCQEVPITTRPAIPTKYKRRRFQADLAAGAEAVVHRLGPRAIHPPYAGGRQRATRRDTQHLRDELAILVEQDPSLTPASLVGLVLLDGKKARRVARVRAGRHRGPAERAKWTVVACLAGYLIPEALSLRLRPKEQGAPPLLQRSGASRAGVRTRRCHRVAFQCLEEECVRWSAPSCCRAGMGHGRPRSPSDPPEDRTREGLQRRQVVERVDPRDHDQVAVRFDVQDVLAKGVDEIGVLADA